MSLWISEEDVHGQQGHSELEGSIWDEAVGWPVGEWSNLKEREIEASENATGMVISIAQFGVYNIVMHDCFVDHEKAFDIVDLVKLELLRKIGIGCRYRQSIVCTFGILDYRNGKLNSNIHTGQSCVYQSCPRVTFLGPEPTRPDPTRGSIRPVDNSGVYILSVEYISHVHWVYDYLGPFGVLYSTYGLTQKLC